MPETCNLNDCPVSVRVDALKEEFNTFRASAFSTRSEEHTSELQSQR